MTIRLMTKMAKKTPSNLNRNTNGTKGPSKSNEAAQSGSLSYGNKSKQHTLTLSTTTAPYLTSGPMFYGQKMPIPAIQALSNLILM